MLAHVLVRSRWLQEHPGLLSSEQMASIDEKLWARLVQNLESRYWRREVAGLADLIEQVRHHRPQALEKSFLGSTRIRPRWMYRFRDLLFRA